jgi:hypothetical protein
MNRFYKKGRKKIPFTDVFQCHGNNTIDIRDAKNEIIKMFFNCLETRTPLAEEDFHLKLYYGCYNLSHYRDTWTPLRASLDQLLHRYVEATGRYCGCQYWSVKARNLFITKLSKNPTPTLHDAWLLSKKLSHEIKRDERPELKKERIMHGSLFPRNYLLKLLDPDKHPSFEYVKAKIEQNAVGCVILQSEYQLFNKLEIDCDNPWLRYKGKIKLANNLNWDNKQRRRILEANLL